MKPSARPLQRASGLGQAEAQSESRGQETGCRLPSNLALILLASQFQVLIQYLGLSKLVTKNIYL